MCDDLDKPRILFAEDHPDILEMYLVESRARGWCAHGATSAEEMIDKVNEKCVNGGPCWDIIVTDVSFGVVLGLTGTGAARKIREVYKDLPILFLTAFNGPMTREITEEIGNAEVIDKPIELSHLFARLQNLIRWKIVRYTGDERRGTSVNRTRWRRRITDKIVKPNEKLTELIESVRKGDS